MRGTLNRPERIAWTIAGCLVAFMAVFAAGCGSSSSSGSRNTDMLQKLGKNEGDAQPG